MVIAYNFCWVWKLYKSAVRFPMANQLNFPYLSIFITFGWCLLLGSGGRSLICVIHVLNKASCLPHTPWCHRTEQEHLQPAPRVPGPPPQPTQGPAELPMGCPFCPPKGAPRVAPRSLTETCMGADAKPLKAAFGNNGSGGGFPGQGPSVRATTASRGGGWEPPLSAAAPTYLGGEEQKCQSSSLTACEVSGIAVLSFIWGDAPRCRRKKPGSPGGAVSQQNPFVFPATTEKDVVLRKMHLPPCQCREKRILQLHWCYRRAWRVKSDFKSKTNIEKSPYKMFHVVLSQPGFLLKSLERTAEQWRYLIWLVTSPHLAFIPEPNHS